MERRGFFAGSALLLLIAVWIVPAQDSEALRKYAGTYTTAHEFGGSSITLNSDGRFQRQSWSDDGTEGTTSGKYQILDGRLHFLISISVEGVRGGRQFNLLAPKDAAELFHHPVGETKRDFVMLPIEWSGRMYLLYEEALKNFANAVNLAIEPRSRLQSMRDISPWYGSFFLREGDQMKDTKGPPRLPEPWKSFLLPKPVVATIKKIDKIEKGNLYTVFTATINKGTRNGLKVGMHVVLGDEEPGQWSGTEIIAVTEKTATIRAETVRTPIKIGDKVSSVYKLSKLQRRIDLSTPRN